ncbi:MAG TPA: Nif3-like dinuclear metal center hexameric protein [Bacillota bacterium]
MGASSAQAVRVRDVVHLLETWAPPGLAEEWDRVGLEIGDPQQPVRHILVALELGPEVVEEAIAASSDLIICHHPLLFRSLRTLSTEDPVARLAVRLVRAGVAVYAAHTNLDRAPGGVNDVLAERLGLPDAHRLPDDPAGYVRVGDVRPPVTLAQLAKRVREALSAPFVLVAGEPGRPCGRVAVCGGSGGEWIDACARAGVDVFVTADIKHHQAQRAHWQGLAIIDAGHYATEWPIVSELQRRLAAALAPHGVRVEVARHAQAFRSFWRVCQ